MSDLLMDTISLPQNATGGTSSFSLHLLLGNSESVYTLHQQGSYTVDYKITGSPSSNDLDWESLVKHYMKKSDEFLMLYSVLNSWKTITTPSPVIDQSNAKLIINGLASLNRGLTKKKAKLIQKYHKEKIKYFHYLQGIGTEQFIDKIFKNVADVLVQLPYEDVAVEITPDKSIFFEIRMHELILHFKLILSDPLNPMAFFAMYKDSSCLDNGVGTVNDILNHLQAMYDRLSSRALTAEQL